MKISLLLGASALALGACSTSSTPLPDIALQTAPTLISAPQSVAGYQNPLAGFQDRRPTEPRPWRALNDEQSEAN